MPGGRLPSRPAVNVEGSYKAHEADGSQINHAFTTRTTLTTTPSHMTAASPGVSIISGLDQLWGELVLLLTLLRSLRWVYVRVPTGTNGTLQSISSDNLTHLKIASQHPVPKILPRQTLFHHLLEHNHLHIGSRTGGSYQSRYTAESESFQGSNGTKT